MKKLISLTMAVMVTKVHESLEQEEEFPTHAFPFESSVSMVQKKHLGRSSSLKSFVMKFTFTLIKLDVSCD